MNGREFSALAERARLDAEQELLDELTAAWQKGIEDAARLLSHGITAAADWQPPHRDPLETAVFAALVAKLATKIGQIRLRGLRTVAKTLRVRVKSLDSVARQNDLTGFRLREAVGGELHRLTRIAREQDLSASEASTLIRDGIEKVAPSRAAMLARTELTQISNSASAAAATDAGIRFKAWLSARDPAVRDTHDEADGQIVPIGDQFTVCGGQRCDAPGDPSLSDDCLCNCRCTLVYGDTLAELEGLLASAAGSTIPAMATVSTSGRPAARRRVAVPPPDDPSPAAAINAPEPEAIVAAARALPFSGVAAVEGVLSDDNTYVPRVLLPNSLSWPELPVPLMAQTKTAEGHDGADIAGRIDSFTRSREKQIKFRGELTTPFGVDEIAPMVEDKTLRFISLDLGASDFALVYRDDLKEVPDAEASKEEMQAGKYALGLKSGKIKAATLVPTPALGGTEIALTASADSDEATITFPASFIFGEPEEDGAALGSLIRYALTAAANLETPPRDWFDTAEPPGKMPLTVTDDGRVFGHIATWDTCHVGHAGCVKPPRSPSGYSKFHVCELDTDAGPIAVGKLMFSPRQGGHADSRATARAAAAYYDRTGMTAAYLRASDGEHGIWVCGSLNPSLSAEQRKEMRRELRLHPPSGDWRPSGGGYELICALAVAVPGFPVPRPAPGLALIASAGEFEADEVALLAMEAEVEEFAAERRLRTLAARAQGIEALASLATD